ncbi:GDSL-type esterase/lipase family protein [Candidatus Nanosynbacter lyticus]|uniref:GDSL-type esterase/lipase family protein n=1 Tax=Candidatus Nanosynbacter lyticus TaxID=2093824 RepID=UPI0025565795|nr:GDSL-type esterase/lipase family protein [Candidatus Nanosynbacter lyticus]WLD46428.1 GDSL-type esterase/lipase family protein [Candidatus Nanosynbacter lyticus]
MNWDNSGGYEGQDSPLGRLHGYDNKGVLQKMALNEMIPGRVKQIEFVKKYQPKVITLTAGGNDVGFGNKLKACVPFPSTCVYAKTEERRKLKNEILDQFERLKSFYEELKAATDNKAKIYVLGYPQFINGAPDAPCGGRGLLYLDAREREMITNSVSYLNGVIRQASKAAGVKYIDVENAFGNHWLCGDKPTHVNPLLLVEEVASRQPDFHLPPVERQESFHPNAKGHADIARAFKKELGGVNPVDYKICKNDATTCPDNSATRDNIPTPPYFNVTNEQEDIKFTYYKLSNGTATKVQEKHIEIKTSRRPYKPWKKVYVKIYSEPRDLGEIEADENGEINGSVALPEDLPAGYHTLVVSGEAPDGKKQELYQTILVKGPNPEDIDENDTPDKLQPCGAFAQAANKDEDLDGIDDACDPEITDPILYTARNGKSLLGEDEDRIYLFRNTRAANLTGITNDYVDKSKNQNNADALVGHTLSEETRGLAFDKLVVMKEADGDIKKGTPIILAKDVNEKCYALKPEDYLSPALKPGSKKYKLRGLTKLNTLPKGVGCEE